MSSRRRECEDEEPLLEFRKVSACRLNVVAETSWHTLAALAELKDVKRRRSGRPK